jgi:predicted RNase H-like HicB family nuclease
MKEACEGDALMATLPKPPDASNRSFKIEFDREDDGRWIAEVPELPGVMAYGLTKQDAEVAVTALALRVIADQTEQIRKPPKSIHFS